MLRHHWTDLYKRRREPLPKRDYLSTPELQARDLVATIAGQMAAGKYGGFITTRGHVLHAIEIVEETEKQLLEIINTQEGRK